MLVRARLDRQARGLRRPGGRFGELTPTSPGADHARALVGSARDPRARTADRPAGGAGGLRGGFAQARRLIAASPGFRGLRLARCLERDTGYLLLVEWDRLEDHTEGFRGSAAYQEWRALLHGFYDPFPVVEHFTTVLTADPV